LTAFVNDGLLNVKMLKKLPSLISDAAPPNVFTAHKVNGWWCGSMRKLRSKKRIINL